MTQLLALISTKEITLLKDMNNLIVIDTKGKFRYFYIQNMESWGIINFISRLEENYIYTIIPMISMLGKDEDPYIVLSKQILVSKNSSPRVIEAYLENQFDTAVVDFGLTNLAHGNHWYTYSPIISRIHSS